MIEPLYVIDSHTLFWYLTDDKKLSRRVAEIFSAAERGETQLAVSAIVLAEIFHLNLKRKTPLDFGAVYRQLAESAAYQLFPLNPPGVLDFLQDSSVPELHDRIIAGLARRLDAPLLTVDPAIAASGVARVEW